MHSSKDHRLESSCPQAKVPERNKVVAIINWLLIILSFTIISYSDRQSPRVPFRFRQDLP